ncbi:MAG: hypothetical protein ACLR23_25275 [Clostridia bacterium]
MLSRCCGSREMAGRGNWGQRGDKVIGKAKVGLAGRRMQRGNEAGTGDKAGVK